MKFLDKKLADNGKSSYAQTFIFMRKMFVISLVTDKNLFLRGSRTLASAISRKIDEDESSGICLCSTIDQARH